MKIGLWMIIVLTSDHRILEFDEFWRFLKSLLIASVTDYQITVIFDQHDR